VRNSLSSTYCWFYWFRSQQCLFAKAPLQFAAAPLGYVITFSKTTASHKKRAWLCGFGYAANVVWCRSRFSAEKLCLSKCLCSGFEFRTLEFTFPYLGRKIQVSPFCKVEVVFFLTVWKTWQVGSVRIMINPSLPCFVLRLDC